MRIVVAALFLIALAGCGRNGEAGGNDQAWRAEFRERGLRTCQAAAPAELANIGRWSDQAAAGIPVICGCTLELAMKEKTRDQLREQSERDLTPAERAGQRDIFTVCVDQYLQSLTSGAAGPGQSPGFTPRPPTETPTPTQTPTQSGGRARARANLSSYVTGDDYPASALRNNETGRVAFTLMVGPNGRVTNCVIRASSGSAALDSATCRIMRSRARFTPALDARGAPTTDTSDGTIIWRLED